MPIVWCRNRLRRAAELRPYSARPRRENEMPCSDASRAGWWRATSHHYGLINGRAAGQGATRYPIGALITAVQMVFDAAGATSQVGQTAPR